MEPLGLCSVQQISLHESVVPESLPSPQQPFMQTSPLAFGLALWPPFCDRGRIPVKVLVLAPVAQQESTEARGTDWEGLLEQRFFSINERS